MVEHREDFDGFDDDPPPSGPWDRFVYRAIVILVTLLAGAVWADSAALRPARRDGACKSVRVPCRLRNWRGISFGRSAPAPSLGREVGQSVRTGHLGGENGYAACLVLSRQYPCGDRKGVRGRSQKVIDGLPTTYSEDPMSLMTLNFQRFEDVLRLAG